MKSVLNVGILLASAVVVVGGAMQAVKHFQAKNYKGGAMATVVILIGSYAAQEAVNKMKQAEA